MKKLFLAIVFILIAGFLIGVLKPHPIIMERDTAPGTITVWIKNYSPFPGYVYINLGFYAEENIYAAPRVAYPKTFTEIQEEKENIYVAPGEVHATMIDSSDDIIWFNPFEVKKLEFHVSQKASAEAKSFDFYLDAKPPLSR